MGRVTYWFVLLPAVLVLCITEDAPAQARRRAPPTSVVINEILASNGRCIADPQGEYDDWIELYNGGDVAVDVGGCYLTDDLKRPTKWLIPMDAPAATTIAAHGYLLVWADGETADRGLHAAFKLSDDGEEAGFFAFDGVTLIDSLSFGPQQSDISYGRLPDGGAELQFFGAPTPGAANVSIHEGIVATPQISVQTRLCTEPVTVTITTATEGATIYYSVDGSDPLSQTAASRGRTGGGSIATAPLRITKTTTLKAVASKPGWRQSAMSVERYIFIGPDVLGFSSPLPIAIIDSLGRSVSTVDNPAFAYFTDVGAGGRAAVAGPNDFTGWGTFSIRGKSSGGFPKHQYHFETQDEQGDDKDVSILGFPFESDWILQGMYSDKSLMRNVLAYQWSNDLGRYAARTRFIELFLNSDDSPVTMNDYIGVFVFMEKIKISSNRVDIGHIEPGDNSEPEITGGYIIKKDKLDPDDQTFGTGRQSLVYMDPNGQDLTQLQRDWVRNFMIAFETALYGSNYQDPVSGYAKYIDVDSFIDHHIVVELCKNIDGFRLSTYMFKDRGGKLNMGPVWDYDLSLGNANYNDGWNATGWYYRLLGDGDYPYWRRLFEDPEFRLRYADRWFAARRGPFTTDRLLGMIEDYATLLDEPAARNFARWQILGVYVWPNWYIAKTYREEITWMKGWVADRVKWMDGQIAVDCAPAPPGFSRQGGQVDPGFELAMSGPGLIYYTLDGSDPRSGVGPIRPATTVTLVAENASKRALVPAGPVDDGWRGGGAFDDSAWTPVTGTPGSVGYNRNFRSGNLFSLDVGTQMYGLRTSCFIRIPFAFTGNPNSLDSLTLRVRYDDAFVAYLNGVEIARRNLTGVALWASTADRQNTQWASTFEDIQIVNFDGILRRADNVLAIQGLNASADSPTFVISAELVANESSGPDTAARVNNYSRPIRLSRTTQIKARALIAGKWTAMNEAVFAVGPVAESLRISEIMYHPADTGNPDDPNTEYIELMNIGPQTINLNLVKFTDGIEFTFPSFDLPPAGCCLVVKDMAAFEAKYGPGLPIAGPHTGSLSNAGERIELQDAAGRTIHRFEYRDDWYDATDGRGFSLIVRDPFTVDPSALGDEASWRPSANPGGSPGSVEPPKP